MLSITIAAFEAILVFHIFQIMLFSSAINAARLLTNTTKHKFIRSAFFSSIGDTELLPDRRRIPSTPKFYAEEGLDRRYYYTIDTRGHLFLESATCRVFATCMRDKKFLNFFYRMLKRNTTEWFREIPYVSLCGKEINFVTPEDPLSSVVFLDLDEPKESLLYGCGSLKERFYPSLLSWSRQTLRIYHPLLNHQNLGREVGLLHPTLADEISSHIEWDDQPMDPDKPKHKLHWGNQTYVLSVLEDVN